MPRYRRSSNLRKPRKRNPRIDDGPGSKSQFALSLFIEGTMPQRRIAIAAFLVLAFVGAASAKSGAGSVFFGFSEPA